VGAIDKSFRTRAFPLDGWQRKQKSAYYSTDGLSKITFGYGEEHPRWLVSEIELCPALFGEVYCHILVYKLFSASLKGSGRAITIKNLRKKKGQCCIFCIS